MNKSLFIFLNYVMPSSFHHYFNHHRHFQCRLPLPGTCLLAIILAILWNVTIFPLFYWLLRHHQVVITHSQDFVTFLSFPLCLQLLPFTCHFLHRIAFLHAWLTFGSVGNGIGDPTSETGRGWLNFTSYFLKKAWIQLLSFAMSINQTSFFL